MVLQASPAKNSMLQSATIDRHPNNVWVHEGLAAAVIDALTSNICVVDGEGTIVAVNRSWKLFGEANAASRTEVGVNYLEVCRNAAGPASEEASAFVEGMESVLKGKNQLFQMEYPCHSPAEFRWFQARVTPLRLPLSDSQSKGMSAVVSHMNITNRIRVEQELAKLAATDPLTGLPNRRFFEQVADAELHQVQRFGKPAFLIMIDIDRFKSINDTHGHAAGDDVLRAVASLSKDIVRGDDLFFRFGGEEFVCLLRATDQPGALAMAERLRSAIEKLQIAIGSTVISVTASFGLANITTEDLSIDSVLTRADKALYSAKAGGRNCIRSTDALNALCI